ncbi:uncharacterized protein SOCEGT47_029340 [Sorangium cellulosum]|uniref:Uncharacterized protein n=1 Tax=Sorangium cellulosum TaxID=56 RepID=A0A4P2Q081_SORCE|nr:hypothetical protein [Sorangium cellulosum]AUX22431.1 uncharacterized protein SOCEGT47_029340 [Sorangium cellulosum]
MDERDDMDEMAPAPRPITWDIHREGRRWTAEEFHARTERLIDLKLEVSRGKLFWDDETRLLLLGMLLENVGLDAAVRLGDLSRWKEAIAAAEHERQEGRSGGTTG